INRETRYGTLAPLARPHAGARSMLDHRNGHSNGNGKLIVEDLENLTCSVHRSVFVSPEILEDENRAIFDKCWVYVGHASEIKNPGDFSTRHVACRPGIFCRY